MRSKHVIAIATAFAFFIGLVSITEARGGGCKRRGGASAQAGSCCGSAAQASATGSSCCSKSGQNTSMQTPGVNTSSLCNNCGMSCQLYAKSRMVVEYDGIPAQTLCSLHCAALGLAYPSYGKEKSIMVGDFSSEKMINARMAHWVIGGSKPGVMTKTGTWAFNQKRDAENFIKENGGEIGDFNDAIDAIYEDIKSSIKMTKYQ